VRILAGTLFDGTVSEPARDVVIDIEGDRISSVRSPRDDDGNGAEVIDARAFTVLPGLINCHDHFSYHGQPGTIEQMMGEDRARLAIQAAGMAHWNISHGITTVRSAGDKDFLDVILRTAIEDRVVAGPRIVAAGSPLMMTGGHGYPVGHEFDGVDEGRAAARHVLKHGSDFVKIIATGGVLGSRRGEQPFLPELSVGEIRAIVDVVHGLGHRVAAHAHGPVGIENCLDADVDSIEHGTLVTPELADRMASQGTVLVPTLSALHRYATRGVELGRPKASQEAAAAVYEEAVTAVQQVIGTGVKIAAGSDSLGDLVEEIEILAMTGLSAIQAINAATGLAAELADLPIGVVTSGNYADLIIVDVRPSSADDRCCSQDYEVVPKCVASTSTGNQVGRAITLFPNRGRLFARESVPPCSVSR
jgi:imidazolonepropionase-like amidohydrolase